MTAQLTDRYRAEEAVLDAVNTHPAQRGRGYGDALLAQARALAGAVGCDLVVLAALVTDWPRHWYARRGFTAAAHSWEATIEAPHPGS